MSAAGDVAVLSDADSVVVAGAGTEAAGLSSGLFCSWQAAVPAAAHVISATASLLLNLFTRFLFILSIEFRGSQLP
jgi:hypothetical protein